MPTTEERPRAQTYHQRPHEHTIVDATALLMQRLNLLQTRQTQPNRSPKSLIPTNRPNYNYSQLTHPPPPLRNQIPPPLRPTRPHPAHPLPATPLQHRTRCPFRRRLLSHRRHNRRSGMQMARAERPGAAQSFDPDGTDFLQRHCCGLG